MARNQDIIYSTAAFEHSMEKGVTLLVRIKVSSSIDHVVLIEEILKTRMLLSLLVSKSIWQLKSPARTQSLFS